MAEAPAEDRGGEKRRRSSGSDLSPGSDVSPRSPDTPETRRVKRQLKLYNFAEKARTEALEKETRMQSLEDKVHRLKPGLTEATAKIDELMKTNEELVKTNEELMKTNDAAIAKIDALMKTNDALLVHIKGGEKLMTSVLDAAKDWSKDNEDNGDGDGEAN